MQVAENVVNIVSQVAGVNSTTLRDSQSKNQSTTRYFEEDFLSLFQPPRASH